MAEDLMAAHRAGSRERPPGAPPTSTDLELVRKASLATGSSPSCWLADCVGLGKLDVPIPSSPISGKGSCCSARTMKRWGRAGIFPMPQP
jgi:hypothetical protein